MEEGKNSNEAYKTGRCLNDNKTHKKKKNLQCQKNESTLKSLGKYVHYHHGNRLMKTGVPVKKTTKRKGNNQRKKNIYASLNIYFLPLKQMSDECTDSRHSRTNISFFPSYPRGANASVIKIDEQGNRDSYECSHDNAMGRLD